MSNLPSVISVVIPTLRRPRLVLQALASVFAQSYRELDVIVVVDGPDEETVAALRSVQDPRLRFFVQPASLTAAGARNYGVAQARGEWIAFLDDDDEWLPHKLERQMKAARSADPVLITCMSRVITPLATYIWPREIFDNSRPLDEYLFDRHDMFAGSAFIQTSSYLMPRTLCERLPFRTHTPHDDWDFLVRLTKELGVRIEMVPEALVNVHFEERRPSLSRADAWAVSLSWVDSLRPILTRRAYSGFCLTVVAPRAASEHAYAAFLPLLVKAFRYGRPRIRHVLVFLAFWAVPQDVRRMLRAALLGERRADASRVR
jgi:glycosyltransferase involved in cell wall biosynthesis